MQLVAIVAHAYAGRNIRPGQNYEAESKFAIALVGAGVSRYAQEKIRVLQCPNAQCLIDGPQGPPVIPEQYETKAMDVESPMAKPARKKRQYKRKDVTPKD